MSDPHAAPPAPHPQTQASSVKAQGPSHLGLWHLPACCFTFALVCYKWACWTLKLGRNTSKSSQDPFTAAFFWETELLWSEAGCWWGWRREGLLADGAGGLQDWTEGDGVSQAPGRTTCYPGLPWVHCVPLPSSSPVSAFHFPNL